MTEPEPTGWELMRAIQAVRGDVSTALQNMVTQGMLTVYQQAQRETDDRQNARLKQLEDDREAERKTRAQQWFAIGLAVLGMVGTIITGVILFNLNRGVA